MTTLLLSLLAICLLSCQGHSMTLSSRLVHRFSDEARTAARSPAASGQWPSLRSPEYYRALVRSDRGRQKRRLGTRYEVLYPSEGSETMNFGNDFGWLHYTWVDIGTPNISFLVALDGGSDLFWVPCDCVQCAPLSGYHGSLEKDLGMYSPAKSRTSKYISCSHELCSPGLGCKGLKQHCLYTVNYFSENTSSSGLLIEDTLYFATNRNQMSIQAPVILGCGRSQTGGYLEGAAPDGLLGLGLGEISVPSVIARAGLVRNSFSMCFRHDDSGRIFFGDQGFSTQKSTPFVTLNGKYLTYIVAVEKFCIDSRCLGKTNLKALVDSGSSFTFLPDVIYRRISLEFDRRVNASRLIHDEPPWEYCYTASSLEMPQIPKVTLVFAVNKTFEVTNPIFIYYGEEGEPTAFCLAIQSSRETLGIIGQNFMTGYHMVFDRENLKLGWSSSDCHSLDGRGRTPLTPPPSDEPENPLPSNQQQRLPNGSAVSPAVAGRTPASIPSTASSHVIAWLCSLLFSLTQATFIFNG